MAVDVFLIDVAGIPEAEIDRLKSRLSLEEKARAEKFVHPESKTSFIVTRAMLRKALYQKINQAKSSIALSSPTTLQIKTSDNGKPYIDQHYKLHFNASHTGSWIVYAISNKPVGIDIELKDRKVDVQPLIERNCHPMEVQQLSVLNGNDQKALFLKLWTLKEAWIKSMGEKISTMPLKQFGFRIVENAIELTNQTEKICSQNFWHKETKKLYVSLAFDKNINAESVNMTVLQDVH